ncbi:hypothetical protein A1O3_00718 [Capronia epimyces CBS 606.96]|uniref:carnosine N-methyltransferase n=1 Tax=Capronia epimyces CBS 606.96 TaxID=1182542 RepID=W9YHY2_9EURO|nr:uncharacterized protein A1O3_00718 [Capronia epimyces CBS 606.96]EXJ92168.1 hypothetical protein A1O3_00718 [Capronia epimyces CBS 606.96]
MLAAPPIAILDTLSAVDDAIDHNADLADAIFQLGLASFGLNEIPPNDDPEWDWHGKAKANDISKAHSTIRQFYRDWSGEGFTLEVKPLLDTILSDLESHLPEVEENRGSPSLLLPGAGLARLLLELCLRGYNVTGNEISYHQLLASNFILNCTQHADQYAIYPFAHTFTNVVSRKNQLRRHTIPDVHPGIALSTRLAAGEPVGEMNMTAGDFVLSYSTPECTEMFDGVVSVFFIDTAPNLIRYIETVRNCLKKGGVWVNIGPLLWHFDDRAPTGECDKDDADESKDKTVSAHDHIESTHPHDHLPGSHHSHDRSSERQGSVHHPTHSHNDGLRQGRRPDVAIEDKGIAEPGSFELSDEEVLQLVSQLGFEITHHGILDDDDDCGDHPNAPPGSVRGLGVGLGYMQDPTSLLQNRYRCSHWVAKKT